MLRAEIIRPSELSPGDREAWAAFQGETPAFRSPLLSAEFALAVAETREDAAVAVFRRQGAAVAFLAHHRRPAGLARPIGAAWSDYHGLISAPDANLDGREALRAAGLSSFRFHGLIDPHGAFSDAGGDDHEAFLIAGDGGGEDYWESLRAASPKRFKNMRRLEHKLAREVGEPVLDAPDHDQAAFDRLIGWKSEQFRRTGLHDVLASVESRRLMQSLFERREGPLQGLLISLKIGGRPIAAQFGVRMGGAFHPWLAAYDPALAEYSPGMTFMSEAIRAMPRLGLASYDLSAGSDHYKRPFASETVVVREGVLRTGFAGVSLGRLTEVLGQGPARTVRRVGRRLDHIAACELSLTGRIHGFAAAMAASSRRLDAQAAYGED
ncbi:MAG TPA: GNAT family N-acetyltransferase [Caulobacteraceae bacterium]|jgi:CelD/BcsL family acetyltransferase involved in cellulose biosynthesis|nr:GNAT family N-acetyltransferase [Caulobacteraceae bacterium]